MAPHPVHHDVQTELGGQVHQPAELVHGGPTDQGAVRLERRSEVEHPYVVQAQPGDLRQVLPGEPRIEVVPCVKPAATRGVVDAEAKCGRRWGRAGNGRGRTDGVLLGASEHSWDLVCDECINHYGRQ